MLSGVWIFLVKVIWGLKFCLAGMLGSKIFCANFQHPVIDNDSSLTLDLRNQVIAVVLERGNHSI